MTAPARRGSRGAPLTRRAARWIDDRLGGAELARTTLNKVFPDHWSFMIGELALYSFVVLVLTGVYLAFFFSPSKELVTYHGAYAPMRGVQMSAAYQSALDISFKVRAGLVMRQVHHWAALLFLAAMVVHLSRIFFTGAFRRPREINWIVGVTLLILGLVNGFAGYSLLDDQLSGTGLRITYGVALSTPVIGTWMTSLLFGGEFPGPDILSRLYVIHILIIPVLIALLISIHLFFVVRHKHTQFAGPGRREHNVVGERMWPTYGAKALGLFFLTASMLTLLGGLFQINPIWIFGPFRPAQVSAASQPDWYMGWLEGALRLVPGWETRLFGFEIPNPFYAGALLGGATFGLLYLWPFIEARLTGDIAEHHLLDRPRQRPGRTAFGVAVLTFYAILFLAGSSDVLASTFHLSVNHVLITFRAAVIVLPLVAAFATRRLCLELSDRDHVPVAPSIGVRTALSRLVHRAQPEPQSPSSVEKPSR